VTAPVYLGVAGTHHSGKTTIARRIEMELRGAGYSVARTSGIAKAAAGLGFPKMTAHTAASTEWIVASTAAAARAAGLQAEVVLVDRTPLDAIAYYRAALRRRGHDFDPRELRRLTAMATAASDLCLLHLVSVLDPAVPFSAEAEPRHAPDYYDPAFRMLVDDELRAVIDVVGLPHALVEHGEGQAAVDAAVRLVSEHPAA
jgi:hypothetical protein